MRCSRGDIVPDMVAPVIGHSILKRAPGKGLLLEVTNENLRDHTLTGIRRPTMCRTVAGAGWSSRKARPVLRAIDSPVNPVSDCSSGERHCA